MAASRSSVTARGQHAIGAPDDLSGQRPVQEGAFVPCKRDLQGRRTLALPRSGRRSGERWESQSSGQSDRRRLWRQRLIADGGRVIGVDVHTERLDQLFVEVQSDRLITVTVDIAYRRVVDRIVDAGGGTTASPKLRGS